MDSEQMAVIKAAYAELVGAYQCAIRDGNGGADNGHDWEAHKETIHDLEDTFGFINRVSLED